jgi:plasmid stability protein
MPTSMTIRDIPNEVRDALAARAARAGQSLQEYIRAELIELARRPTMAELMVRIRARKAATSSTVTTEQTLQSLDEERR